MLRRETPFQRRCLHEGSPEPLSCQRPGCVSLTSCPRSQRSCRFEGRQQWWLHTVTHVKFVVEIKTVNGYRQSQSGCIREAQLQLIGLNAFNTNNSPPVVLSNLAKTHQVLWNYSIRVVNCSSFAAAIHYANTLSKRQCMSQHFSRPSSPDPNTSN